MSKIGRMICEGHLGGFIEGGDPRTYCPDVWQWFVDQGVWSVADIGCGEGHACEWFLRAGCVVLGIDGSETAERAFRVPLRFVRHDYTQGPLEIGSQDLAWSCEFVEHVDEQHVHNYMRTFALCRMVAMTYAAPGQAGHHHVNCKPQEYWVSLFTEYGFRFDQATTLALRDLAPDTHFGERGLVFL